jgi:hypothetical protein
MIGIFGRDRHRFGNSLADKIVGDAQGGGCQVSISRRGGGVLVAEQRPDHRQAEATTGAD